MKRLTAYLLTMAVLLALFAGCSQKSVETAVLTEPTQAQTEGALVQETIQEIRVSTVDEFLSAIEPGAVIRLEEGVYDLSQASDYGQALGSPYYTWVDVYDGYELKIQGVEDLTIRGSGMEKTIISALPRYAHVFQFRKCDNVKLESFTAGHTTEPGACMGGVVSLEECTAISLYEAGLYGCGTIGILATDCEDICVVNSEIYDCSSNGIALHRTDDFFMEYCKLYDLGEGEYGGGSIFDLNESGKVQIENCKIRNNVMQWILKESGPCSQVELRDNQFTENHIRGNAFSLWEFDMVLEGNTFENNSIRIWYDSQMEEMGMTAVDSAGNPITEEMLTQMNQREEVLKELPKQEIVNVKTVDELLSAIRPNTMIVLTGELYDLSTATDYGTGTTDYYYWEEAFDGPSLVITGVDNLTICSTDADVKGHTISAVPRYADVLTFSQCSNILVQGFTAGHTVEPGYCTGGVLSFRDCEVVQADNCGLYGCGILGVQAQYSADVSVTNCEIYECSYGGIRMNSVDGVTIDSCTFRDLGGSALILSQCKNINVDGKDLPSVEYEIEADQ